jgi:16S rRNA (adenine1518-N6/adenine1519-N6)-dimethyltransferase
MTANPELDAASILRRYGLRPRHSLGQNFLEDPAALQQVVQAADVQPEDTVLEIGTGIGSLTRYLARVAERVVGIEVDGELAAICRQELHSQPNAEIVHGDVLDYTPLRLRLPERYLVVANIPYYITSPILRHLLESEPRPQRLVLTMQKEVASRISAQPPEMSLLAISVQVYGTARMVAQIPARAFHPRPKVDSAVLRIDCYEEPRVQAAMVEGFFRIVKAGFLQPRKMLRNSMAAGLKRPPAEMDSVLQRAAVDAHRRAETLTVEEWMRLAELEAARVG